MNRIIFGRKYFIAWQWFQTILLLIVLLVGVFIYVLNDLYTIWGIKSIFAFLFFYGIFVFLFWKKVLSLNIIIQKDKKVLIAKNFIREKTFPLDSVVFIDIKWIWVSGVLHLDSKKKYRFLLDSQHMKKYMAGADSKILEEYWQRLKE